MAALSAAEYNFPDPPPDQPQWLALAQAVFNTQAGRWDTSHCNGGLRWQIFQWNNGFDYKNSVSQACFFNIAARLALYTKNETYALWANRVWDWMIDSHFMTEDVFYIYDGAHIQDNCTTLTPYQWTYNAGAFLLGAAAMYNYTADSSPQDSQTWRSRTDGLLRGTSIFFTGPENNIMTEVACEAVHLCDVDQQSFKAYLSRWMAAATKWAPWTYNISKPLLDASATAAAAQCTGGDNGRMCGLMWANNSGQWDGTTGVGQQMAAMQVVLATMIRDQGAPVTSSTGGTSVGNPAAGASAGGTDGTSSLSSKRPITKADIAGAYILTIIALIFLLGGVWLVVHDEKYHSRAERNWKNFAGHLAAVAPPTPTSRPRISLQTQEKSPYESHANIDKRSASTSAKVRPERSLVGKPARESTPLSISMYSDQGLVPLILGRERQMDGQQQPRATPPMNLSGTFGPIRGNKNGFRMLEVPILQPINLRDNDGFGGARDLTPSNLTRLHRKPLPSRSESARLKDQRLGDKKGWTTLP